MRPGGLDPSVSPGQSRRRLFPPDLGLALLDHDADRQSLETLVFEQRQSLETLVFEQIARMAVRTKEVTHTEQFAALQQLGSFWNGAPSFCLKTVRGKT